MKSTQSHGILHRTATGDVSSLHVGCPVCGRSYVFPLAPGGSADAALHCDGCAFELPIRTSDLSAVQPVETCAVCGHDEFYVQKDFNRVFGLWVVILSGFVAFGIMLKYGHIPGLGVLFAVTLVDWVIYRRLRDVAVCYLCNTIYRGFPRNPEHRAFYLGDEERHKKLRQEWIEKLRRPDRPPQAHHLERDRDERSTVS